MASDGYDIGTGRLMTVFKHKCDMMPVGEEELDSYPLGPGIDLPWWEFALDVPLVGFGVFAYSGFPGVSIFSKLKGFGAFCLQELTLVVDMTVIVLGSVMLLDKGIADLPADNFEVSVPGALLSLFPLSGGVKARESPDLAGGRGLAYVYMSMEPCREDRTDTANISSPLADGFE